MNNKLNTCDANKVFFIVVVLNLVYFVSIRVLELFNANFISTNFYLILIINQFYFTLFPVLLYLIKNKINIKKELGFNRLDVSFSILIILISIPAYIGTSSFNAVVLGVLQSMGYKFDSVHIPPQNTGGFILSVLVVAVSPAICEEVLHRGILLRSYEKEGSTRSILISALLFGLFHFDFKNLLGPIFFGVLIGYYVVRTDSIFSGMLAHFINNLIAIITQYFASDFIGMNEEKIINLEHILILMIVGVLCFLVMIGLLICFHRMTKQKCRTIPPKINIITDTISTMRHWPIFSVLILYVLHTVVFLAISILHN